MTRKCAANVDFSMPSSCQLPRGGLACDAVCSSRLVGGLGVEARRSSEDDPCDISTFCSTGGTTRPSSSRSVWARGGQSRPGRAPSSAINDRATARPRPELGGGRRPPRGGPPAAAAPWPSSSSEFRQSEIARYRYAYGTVLYAIAVV